MPVTNPLTDLIKQAGRLHRRHTGFHGKFIPVYLYSLLLAKPGGKRFALFFLERCIGICRMYRPGFAVYITLCFQPSLSDLMIVDVPLAVAYYINGTGFRMSAERLMDGLELRADGSAAKLTAIPLFFLASHAAELFLKAALIKRGFPPEKLKKFDYRHNLSALLLELKNMGVPVTDETSAVVNRLSQQHTNHQLRYTVLLDDGKKTYWPPLSLVFAMLDELLLLCRISTHGI